MAKLMKEIRMSAATFETPDVCSECPMFEKVAGAYQARRRCKHPEGPGSVMEMERHMGCPLKDFVFEPDVTFYEPNTDNEKSLK